ncbi:MAG: DNA translocase FtsK [Dictyoglomus turgidum]|nr:MAG: DNA translocase FtsK [Dictyoglomus turgidum]
MHKEKLIGIFLLCINIFGLLSWVFPESSGVLGRSFFNFIKNFFGVYLILFIVFEGFIMYYLLFKEIEKQKLISLSLYFLSFLGVFSLLIKVLNLSKYQGQIGSLLLELFPYIGFSGYIIFSFITLVIAVFLSPSLKDISKKRVRNLNTETLRKPERSPKKVVKEVSKENLSMTFPRERKLKCDFAIPTSILSYSQAKFENEDYEQMAKNLEETLKSFKIEAKVKDWNVGPSVIRYNIVLSPGIRVSKVLSLSNDIALALAVPSVRFEAPVPGKSVIGVEIPRSKPVKVYLREILESDVFTESKHPLTFALGKDLIGNIKVANLSEVLHLLIAGTTGSGKSMFINSLIISLLYKNTPETLSLLMIDPKRVELSIYNKLVGRYLRHPVVTEPKKAVFALRWAVGEMERRYEIFERKEVRNIEEYKNLNDEENLPYIVIIIDELNDLMMTSPKEIEDLICRLAQKARAAGIHLVVATQRPSVDVITGLIKANIPSRIAFAVSSQIDSRIILDDGGAEKLIGKGDMLYHPITSSHPVRLQAPYVDEKDIKNVVNYILENTSELLMEPISLESLDKEEEKGEISDFNDPLLPKVIELLKGRKVISTSYIQRKFSIGYNRAARLLDTLEEKGYVASQGEGKPRKVLRGGDEV